MTTETVGVFTTIYGDEDYYVNFLPDWIESIESLDLAPDQVVLCSDRRLSVPSWVELVVISDAPKPDPCRNGRYRNGACERLETDWFWMLDIDDQFFRDSMYLIRDYEDEADIIQVPALVEQEDGGTRIMPPKKWDSAQEFLASSENGNTACSPFRREVWEASPYPCLTSSADWAFWRMAAYNGFVRKCEDRPWYRYRESSAGLYQRSLSRKEGIVKNVMKNYPSRETQ